MSLRWIVGASLIGLVACGGHGTGTNDGNGGGDGSNTGDGANNGDGGGIDGANLDGQGGDASRDGTSGSDVRLGDSTRLDDSGCGTANFAVRARPPNVLVLLDRSCSMQQTPSGTRTTSTDPGSKWAIATRVIGDMTTMYPTQVRWGLIDLPRVGNAGDGVTCSGTPVCGGTTTCPEVAPQPGGGAMVVSALMATGVNPFSVCGTSAQAAMTPIHNALQQTGMVTQLHDATRQDFVMLITDGEETCLGNNVSTVATTLGMDVATLLTAGIKTAVVGFGATGGGGVNPTELNAMANAGGLPASGTNHYYSATDEATLVSALTTIIGDTISCTFPFTGTAPSDPTMLHVYLNGSTTELMRDPTHMNGWDYDATTMAITLYGMPCDEAKHGLLTQISAVAGCGTPPPMCHGLNGTCTTDADCCTLQGLACDTASHTCQQTPG